MILALILVGIPVGATALLAGWILRHRGEGRKVALLGTLMAGGLSLVLTPLAYLVGFRLATGSTQGFLTTCRRLQHACATWFQNGFPGLTVGRGLLVLLALWAAAVLLRRGVLYLKAQYRLWRHHPLDLQRHPRLQRALTQAVRLAGLSAFPRVYLLSVSQAQIAIFGIRRPVLLLSPALLETLSDEELRAVLLHELGHFRFRDNLWNLLGGLLRDFLAPLPFARRLFGQLQEEMEYQVDRWVVRRLASPLPLAEALVKVAASGGPQPAAGRAFAEPQTHLGRRLQNLLHPPGTFPWRVFLVLWSLSVFLPAASGFALGEFQGRHRPPALCTPTARFHAHGPGPMRRGAFWR